MGSSSRTEASIEAVDAHTGGHGLSGLVPETGQLRQMAARLQHSYGLYYRDYSEEDWIRLARSRAGLNRDFDLY